MATRVALGIDLGTSGVKSVLLGEAGSVLASAGRSYAVSSPRPGWAEIDPEVWERAARDAVGQLLAEAPGNEVVAVGIDGQMHGTVLVDQQGQAVRPAVLWPDSRATDQMARWQDLDEERRAVLANPLAPGMPGPVLGWLAEHAPASLDRASAFVMPKDWLRSRLVGGPPATDASDASATLLWDVTSDAWSVEVADLTGVPPRLLPPVLRSTEPAGRLDPAVAKRWGLPAYVPVGVGCADAAATLLGCDAAPGRVVLTVGTGAQLVLPGVEAEPVSEPGHHLYRDALGGWYAMAAVMNAGLALARVIELLGADWEELYRPRERDVRLPGFVPFFTGERVPVPQAGGRAGWFDVDLATSRADLLAAALEGVAFTIRHAFEVMPSSAEEVDLVGGGALTTCSSPPRPRGWSSATRGSGAPSSTCRRSDR